MGRGRDVLLSGVKPGSAVYAPGLVVDGRKDGMAVDVCKSRTGDVGGCLFWER